MPEAKLQHESVRPLGQSGEGDHVVARSRLRVRIGGAVQGVGFRPFVYRLATELGLNGWVRNDLHGVEIEVEASTARLRVFLDKLRSKPPARSRIASLEAVWLDPQRLGDFAILPSAAPARSDAWIQPDSATCPDCLREVMDPQDRRYRYPFANCTHCGPRYSIIERMPYDRPFTSMKRFRMCRECESEYQDPLNRRFHAQPNACPVCGPQLALWDASGQAVATADAALAEAVTAIRTGLIVALKGLGGFHLLVRADDPEAVHRLRTRKRREEKPLALMFPALRLVRACCHCSAAEAQILQSAEAPIVLLRRLSNRADSGDAPVAGNVAPGQSNLGVMLPYTPLHHLLLHDLGTPVVATSGNLSDEPICIDEREALHRLKGIADLFLVHDRPIVRHVDDSIVRLVAGREMVLRRARGFAPLPIPVSLESTPEGEAPVVLGTGAHLKNSVALRTGSQVFVSQHIGDLETVEAHDAFHRVISDLQTLYQVMPTLVATDRHRDYLSTRYAVQSGLPRQAVQHHLAHIAAVMAENELSGPVLGVSWDGTGLGTDNTIWGGEFLRVDRKGWQRVACLRPFPLPGGDLAAREPRRSALGLLHEMCRDRLPAQPPTFLDRTFAPSERGILSDMLCRSINSPLTSSVGRLFDAVASLIDLRHRCAFEGQAAMELEALAEVAAPESDPYPFPLAPAQGTGTTHWLDWEPLVQCLLRDVESHAPRAVIARRFHLALIEAVCQVADWSGDNMLALGGGCFQNRLLLEGCVSRGQRANRRVYWPQRIPPNDGGLALGQVAVACWHENPLAK